MAEFEPLVDLLALYHTDRELPCDVFVVRKQGDISSLNRTIGRTITDRLISRVGEGVPRHRPSYRVEAIEPLRLMELAHELDLTAIDPEGIVTELKTSDTIAVHEVGSIGREEDFFHSA